MIYEITDTDPVASLFGKWEETLIWSCLQNVMGKIYADDLKKPTTAMAIETKLYIPDSTALRLV